MDVEQIVARLTEATDTEITEALAYVTEQGRTLRDAELTEDNVTKLEALGAARTQLQAEKDRRVGLAARATAAGAAFGEEEAATEEAAEELSEEAAADTSETDAAADTEESTETVTASGGKAKLGSIGKKAKNPVTPNALAVRATTTSLADTSTAPAGTTLDRWTLADAMLERQNRVTRSTVEGRQYVARLSYAYPEERILRRDASAHVNSSKIESVTQPEALTAAGGLCAPLENIYDINVVGVTNRPIRDALARFAVDRGGIQYRQPMDALVMTDGLGIWTVENDEAADTDPPPVTKTCAIIECPAVVEAVVYSTYLCLQYPNFTARFDREWVDATTRAAMIAWARFAENQLLSRILAGSKLLHQPVIVSAVRDVLVALDKAVAYYRNRHRLDSMVPLRMILPRWVLDLFRADIARGFPGHLDALAVADAQIMAWFRARGVNVTFHLDGLAGATVNTQVIPDQFYANAAAGAVIPEFIDKIDAVLFAEGDWLYLDGGTLDLGLVRDSSLNRINRYQQFVENFEGVAFNGVESLRLVLEVNPRGAVVGTLDPTTIPED